VSRGAQHRLNNIRVLLLSGRERGEGVIRGGGCER